MSCICSIAVEIYTKGERIAQDIDIVSSENDFEETGEKGHYGKENTLSS